MEIESLTKDIEFISASYAGEFGIVRSDEWCMLKLTEELGELTQAYLKLSGQARTNGVDEAPLRVQFEDELADVLGQLLVLAHHHKVDLPAAMERKWLSWLPVITKRTST